MSPPLPPKDLCLVKDELDLKSSEPGQGLGYHHAHCPLWDMQMIWLTKAWLFEPCVEEKELSWFL